MIAFCEKLKSLRGDRSIEELANASGIAPSWIYKAEQTAKVRWSSVEKLYDGIFRDETEKCETLLLWALGQSNQSLLLSTAEETLGNILRTAQGNQTEKLLNAFSTCPPADQHLLMDFCLKFCESASIREMVRAWAAAMEEK